jgi:hypothetical protein
MKLGRLSSFGKIDRFAGSLHSGHLAAAQRRTLRNNPTDCSSNSSDMFDEVTDDEFLVGADSSNSDEIQDHRALHSAASRPAATQSSPAGASQTPHRGAVRASALASAAVAAGTPQLSPALARRSELSLDAARHKPLGGVAAPSSPGGNTKASPRQRLAPSLSDSALPVSPVPEGWEGRAAAHQPSNSSSSLHHQSSPSPNLAPPSLPPHAVLYDDDGSVYYGNPSLRSVQREFPSVSVEAHSRAPEDISPSAPMMTAGRVGSIWGRVLDYRAKFDFAAAFRTKAPLVNTAPQRRGLTLMQMMFGRESEGNT